MESYKDLKKFVKKSLEECRQLNEKGVKTVDSFIGEHIFEISKQISSLALGVAFAKLYAFGKDNEIHTEYFLLSECIHARDFIIQEISELTLEQIVNTLNDLPNLKLELEDLSNIFDEYTEKGV